MLREIDWSTLESRPEHKESLVAYYETGEHPGHFLENILRNDLQKAVLDSKSDGLLPEISYLCRWLYRHMPAMAHGSIFRYDDWRTRGGEQGRLKEQLSAPVTRRVVGDEKAEQSVNE